MPLLDRDPLHFDNLYKEMIKRWILERTDISAIDNLKGVFIKSQVEQNGLAPLNNFLSNCEEIRKQFKEEDFSLILEKIKSKKNPDNVSFIKIKNFIEDVMNALQIANMNASSSINQVMQ